MLVSDSYKQQAKGVAYFQVAVLQRLIPRSLFPDRAASGYKLADLS